ncbi:NAD(P)H-quinone oxidoreductase [Nocardioides insulae]|uniref:NAD(P)H-quinone oxidoreductase n=1 Tax=Nocardioides insulae TaxID=394734 RepID=UPI0003FB7A28|nr:NAD(P)H-quinone oxidoreductase [Nocardioides insulae]
MRAVLAQEPCDPDDLRVIELPDPEPGPGEVVLAVAAAGLNRADVMQRRGFYPPPPGSDDVLGMECSGTVAAVGDGVEGWQVGDEACALLASGGYATRVAVPAGQLMPVPAGVGLVEAAALPEVAATVWSNIVMAGRLGPGDRFLVHGGSGGIGTFAIQLASALGAQVLTTVGSPEKAAAALELGADVVIDYREQDFVDVVRERTDGHGADVILDNMGAKYLARNLDALADGGRLVIIGLQGGTKAELDINKLLRKRGSVIATALRSRPVEGKSAICAEVVEHVWPLVTSGAIKPIIHEIMPLEDAGRAHTLMESGEHRGKILLRVDG